MITPPIILDNRGDITILESIEAAERHAEPVDIMNGEYVIYDSVGRVLQGVVERRLMGDKTRIVEPHSEQYAVDALRERLVRSLSIQGQFGRLELSAKSLTELISLMTADR